jgi:superfamily II DNA helicase RecQ
MLKKMIDEGEGSREQKQRLHDMLRTVVQYCENKADCRRAQVLGYFSEPFNPADCNKTCDNCRSDTSFVTKDLTDYAAMAFKLVSKVHADNVTMHQCVDAFRGAKSAKIKKSGLEGYGWGYGADLDRGDNERIFQSLLETRSLKEESVVNKVGFATNYLHVSIFVDLFAITNIFSRPLLVTTTKPSVNDSNCKFENQPRKALSERSKPRSNQTIRLPIYLRQFAPRNAGFRIMPTSSSIPTAMMIITQSHSMLHATKSLASTMT